MYFLTACGIVYMNIFVRRLPFVALTLSLGPREGLPDYKILLVQSLKCLLWQTALPESAAVYFVYSFYCFNLFVCPHPFVFP